MHWVASPLTVSLLTHESRVLQGNKKVEHAMTITASAFVHVASAVVVALAATWLVKRTIAGAGRAPSLEISEATLAALGIWLLWRGLPQGHVHNEGIVVGIFAGLIPVLLPYSRCFSRSLAAYTNCVTHLP